MSRISRSDPFYNRNFFLLCLQYVCYVKAAVARATIFYLCSEKFSITMFKSVASALSSAHGLITAERATLVRLDAIGIDTAPGKS